MFTITIAIHWSARLASSLVLTMSHLLDIHTWYYPNNDDMIMMMMPCVLHQRTYHTINDYIVTTEYVAPIPAPTPPAPTTPESCKVINCETCEDDNVLKCVKCVEGFHLNGAFQCDCKYYWSSLTTVTAGAVREYVYDIVGLDEADWLNFTLHPFHGIIWYMT